MADLIARLKLDDKQFNDNIKRSKQQMQSFSAVGSKVGVALKGMAGAMGVAYTAGEVFNGMMKNSQVFGDKMNEAMAGAEASVKEFYYMLGTGDFSGFINGIDSIISKAAEAQAALDQLGNTRISYGFVRSESRREIAEGKTQANNRELSNDERKLGFDKWSKGLEKQKRDVNVFVHDVQEAVKKMALTNTALVEVSIDDIKEMARLDIQAPSFRSDEKDKLAKDYEEYEKKLADLGNGDRRSVWKDGKLLSYEQQRLALAKEHSKSILYNNLLAKKSDEEWSTIVQHMMEADDAVEELGSQQEEYNSALKGFNDEKTAKQKVVIPKTGSIAKVDKDIQEITTRIKYEVDPAKKAQLEKQLRELKIQKIKLELDFLNQSQFDESLEVIQEKISKLNALLKLAVDEESKQQLYKEIEELTEKERVIKFRFEHQDSEGSKKVDKPKTPSFASMANVPKLDKLPKLKPQKVDKSMGKNVDGVNDYAAALTNCAGAIAAFNCQKLEDNGEGWAQWSSNLLAAAASTIIGLQSLTMAKGVNSAFDLPFPANLAAAAMVLSTVISLFASIPAFADGGIVNSAFTTQDKNLVRVNGGEMILNKSQQANLFKLLDGNMVAGSASQIQFKLRGSDIYGSLTNYNKKYGKLR